MSEKGSLPPIAKDWGYAFYYGSLYWITAWFRGDPDTLGEYLPEGFEAAVFDDGMGAVGLNPMTYGSHLENMVEATTEAELNVVAYPSDRAGAVPTISFEDFLKGAEQTKTMGNFRVWVPCNDPFAVQAGKQTFGENKFVTTLNYSFPGPNSPATAWRFRACDPDHPPVSPDNPPAQGGNVDQACDASDPDNYIFYMSADVSDPAGLTVVDGSVSPIVDYSVRADQPGGPLRPGGSFRNVLGALRTYLPGSGALNVQVTTGTSTHDMTAAVKALVEGQPCAGVQIFQSLPPVIESRPFYADQG